MITELHISDQRMLQLMEWAIKNKIATNETDYCKQIEFRRSNIINIKNLHQSFSKFTIVKACEITGANANWILGIEEVMFRSSKSKSAMQLLKEATVAIELELKALTPVNKKVNRKIKTGLSG